METNKYTEAVRLLNDCRDVEDNVELHIRLDRFVTHLCDNFPTPDVTDPAQIDAMAALLLGTAADLEAAVREIPPDMEDAFYPIALMRVALLVYRIPIDPDKVKKQFDRFRKTYGPLLIEATSAQARRQAKPYEYKPKGLSENEQEIIKRQAEAQDNE
jgi:hypothetical protein